MNSRSPARTARIPRERSRPCCRTSKPAGCAFSVKRTRRRSRPWLGSLSARARAVHRGAHPAARRRDDARTRAERHAGAGSAGRHGAAGGRPARAAIPVGAGAAGFAAAPSAAHRRSPARTRRSGARHGERRPARNGVPAHRTAAQRPRRAARLARCSARALRGARDRPARGGRVPRRARRDDQGRPHRSGAPAGRVPVRRPHRHRQDRDRQDARRVPVRLGGPACCGST